MDLGMVMYTLRCEKVPETHVWPSSKRDTKCLFCDSPAHVVAESPPPRDTYRTNWGRKRTPRKDAA